jgi:hypothetical protein
MAVAMIRLHHDALDAKYIKVKYMYLMTPGFEKTNTTDSVWKEV